MCNVHDYVDEVSLHSTNEQLRPVVHSKYRDTKFTCSCAQRARGTLTDGPSSTGKVIIASPGNAIGGAPTAEERLFIPSSAFCRGSIGEEI
ncbi:hypothetical protein BDQ94DRAFT_154001 [Aspergillus welwitschiae]|uniref:Uncharacterized protein n=1 Tax=Aspergillus welwitschiae TaxID=1341132 RepID=A0A3F3PKT2_9EURO|nr:hypothetical protein BDQ94DRAFT_154001 [Aspergillus welwitschiae]RDH27423.1 hypothetical protein BDQ94DRAFT_154001 [Aspergillus welwitschiae]